MEKPKTGFQRLLSLKKNKTKAGPAVKESELDLPPMDPESPISDDLPQSKPTSQGTLGAQSAKEDQDTGLLSMQEIDEFVAPLVETLIQFTD